MQRKKLQNYYTSLRKKENITVSDLESLMRLTEAKDKMELQSIANKSDADIIIQLYEKTLFKEEKKKKKISFLAYLKEMSDEGKRVFTLQELYSYAEILEIKKTADQIIRNLNEQGYLIIKKIKNLNIKDE